MKKYVNLEKIIHFVGYLCDLFMVIFLFLLFKGIIEQNIIIRTKNKSLDRVKGDGLKTK